MNLFPPTLSAAALTIAAVASAAPIFPLKGIVLWRDEARDHPELTDSISLEFSYATPSSLVVGAKPDGSPIIDWAPLEKLLADIASRGHQAILRFRYAYPGEKLPEFPGKRGATGVPKFIKALADYRETFSPNPGGDGPTYYPDWSHPALEDFTLRFFKAFAERYDADPRLAFLEVGFGHWAEYHTHGTAVKLGKNFPSKEFQKVFMEMLSATMRDTPWLVSIDAAQQKYSDLAADPTLAALSFGLFDDSFMHEEHDIGHGDGWNEQCWRRFGTARWRRAPCGGEVSYYRTRDQREFLSPKGLYGITWKEAAAKYHLTFMIGNDSLAGKFATPKRLLEAAAECGYSFRLASAKADGNTLVVEIANDGVAPVYHNAMPAVETARGEIRAAGTLAGLQPGERRTFRLEFPERPPKNAAGSLRIVSPKLLPGAALPLASAPSGQPLPLD